MALTMFYNIIKVVYLVQYAKIGYTEIALEFGSTEAHNVCKFTKQYPVFRRYSQTLYNFVDSCSLL